MQTTVAKKVDQKVAPGELSGAFIKKAGNGGFTVEWQHAPKAGKGNSYPMYEERRPDVFADAEDMCHAIAQAFGADAEIEYREVGDKD